jgi:hypothetical protein
MNGNDTYLDVNNSHLRVTSGNVHASGFNLDQISIVTTSNTGSTINFLNDTKGFTSRSNIEVGTANLFVDTTTSNVGVGTNEPAYTLDVHGSANVGAITSTAINMSGHIIPTTNATYDIGSAAFKIRDMYIDDNSLWIGDEAKISFTGNQLKFRRRKKTIVPSGLVTIGAAHSPSKDEATVQSEALALSVGINAVADMKLHHWVAYAKHLDPTKTAGDIYTDSAADYEASAASEGFKEVGDDIYSAHKISIGKTTAPTTALDVVGTVTATTFAGSGSGLTALNATNITSGTLDAARIPTLNQNTTGSAGSATTAGACSGNSATATTAGTLTTARTIGGVDFDGSEAIVPTTFNGATFNGDVGIGTTSPDRILHLYKNATGSHYQRIQNVENNDGCGIELMRGNTTTWGSTAFSDWRINNSGHLDFGVKFTGTDKTVLHLDTTGNVGIGTTTPFSTLHVGRSAAASGTITADDYYLLIGSNEHGVDKEWRIGFGYNTAGTNVPPAYIGYHEESNSSSTYGDLVFGGRINTTGQTQATEHMRIAYNGNVGIGETDPGAKLDVNGSIRGAYDTDTTSYFGRSAVGYVGHSDWAGFAHIDRNNGSDYALLQNSAGRTIINCKSDQHISFSSGDNTKMRVLANGNVGIGTSDPDEKLHVNGIVKATNLDLDGNVVRSAANITLAANSWAKIADFAGLVTGGHYLISIKWDNSALVGGGTAIWNGGVTYSTYVIGSASVYNTTGDELIKYNAHYHYRTISAFEFVQDSDSSSGNYGQHSIYMKSPQSAIVASGVSVTAYRIG